MTTSCELKDHGIAGVHMSKVLVLNVTYQPICVVSVRRAVVLMHKGKAEMIENGSGFLRSERFRTEIPSVIKLSYYVNVPYRRRNSITKRAVFMRDNNICQYCGAAAENIDHVVPRSRGGAHEWENVVASCKKCNSKKENRALKETGLTLSRRPKVPSGYIWILLAAGEPNPTWNRYIDFSVSKATGGKSLLVN